MEAIDILFKHLKNAGLGVVMRDNTIVYNKPYMGVSDDNGKYSIVAPRRLRFDGTKVTISGNMHESITLELCAPASIQELMNLLDSPILVNPIMFDNHWHGLLVASHSMECSIGHTHIVKSPRSLTNKAPASEAENEGLTPSGGISEITEDQ